jgi:hypothetical protein
VGASCLVASLAFARTANVEEMYQRGNPILTIR